MTDVANEKSSPRGGGRRLMFIGMVSIAAVVGAVMTADRPLLALALLATLALGAAVWLAACTRASSPSE